MEKDEIWAIFTSSENVKNHLSRFQIKRKENKDLFDNKKRGNKIILKKGTVFWSLFVRALANSGSFEFYSIY